MPHAADKPITQSQVKILMTLLRKRGLAADRHALYGVGSIKELSCSDASRAIEALLADKPDGRRKRKAARDDYNRRGARSLKPGEMRLATDATARQRETIRYVLLDRAAAWIRDPAHWLWSRYLVKLADLDTAPLARSLASEIITALDQVVKKHGDSADFNHEGTKEREVVPF